jgi:DNA helicase-2/ATP-dependent DNA helicase PcrA
MNDAHLVKKERAEREEVFLKRYNALNKAQRAAVDAIDGPVMVVAGPGTGKTTLLTLRIAHIVRQTDTSPDSILALTFTDSGVKAMRKKLIGIMGADAYRVGIYTFHGFANELIRRYPEYIKRGVGAQPIDEIAQIEIMERIILRTEDPFAKLKPYGDQYFYVRPVLDAIKKLKQEYIRPDGLETILSRNEKDFLDIPDRYHEKGKYKGEMKGEYRKLEEAYKKNRELLRAYRAYENELHEQGWYDYNDMIIEVVDALRENEDFRLIVQEQFQYVLADEHQDANGVQNTFLELISSFHESPNLFIVGDEKQAIYRFQGASVENFLQIKHKHPDTTVIELEENYRSHQSILDTAHDLIGHSTLPAGADVSLSRVRLVARGDSNTHKQSEPVTVFECATAEDEFEHMVNQIQALQKKKVPLHEISILYRDNKSMFPIAHALRRAGVPYQVISDKNVLADPVVAQFVHLLRVLVDPLNSESFGNMLLLEQFGADSVDVFRALAHAYSKRITVVDVITSRDECEMAGITHVDQFLALGKRIASWIKLVAHTDLVECIERILQESGYIEHVLTQEGKKRSSFEELEMIELFFAEAKKAEARGVTRIADFLNHIDRLQEHELLLKSHAHSFAEHKVVLMTAHRSKGLEFDHVFISQVADGVWGNKRRIQLFKLAELDRSPHTDDDERRLFYVAITRARFSVSIYYALRDDADEEQIPSLFIAELPRTTVHVETISGVAKLLPERIRVQDPSLPMLAADNMAYVRRVFSESALSVTALNNYLECPWNYFFTNLVRLPQGETNSQLYGTAVHEALRLFFEEVKKDGGLPKKPEKRVVALLAEAVHKMPISIERQNDMIARGTVALGAYMSTWATTGVWLPDFEIEYPIRGLQVSYESAGERRSLSLTGKLDKIEYVDGPGTDRVRVVDYKTRKAMSRNEIEGLTKTSNGNYKRQLVFYKLLLSLKKPPFVMEHARIDFIEPDEKGVCKSEVFEVSNDEVAELVRTIERVAAEIYSGEFVLKGCKKKECRFCTLSSVVRLS